MPAHPDQVAKIVDTVTRRIPGLLKKYTVPVVGGVGVGAGIVGAEKSKDQTEKSIMREYAGAPGAKYSSCAELEKFAERKMVLSSRVAFEKKADSMSDSFSSGVERGVGTNIVGEGVAALRRLIGAAAQSIHDKMVDEPVRKQVFDEVAKTDPVVSVAEREMPGQAVRAYMTMKRFAPTLSTDPNVVQSFLRNSAMSGGPMDFQTVRALADAETSVQRAQNEGAWLRGRL